MVCVTLQLAAGVVHAAPGAAERETARALMVEGDRLQAAGDLRNALARYQSAHAIMRVPTTGLSVARVEAKLGMLVEARSSAMEVINLPVSANEPAVFTEARRSAHELAGELEPRVPSLRTTVSPDATAYMLTIDGVTLPTDARQVPYRMNPGVHAVRVEAPGYAPEAREVTLAEGQHQLLEIALHPLAAGSAGPPVPPPPAGTPAGALRLVQDSLPPDPAKPGRLRGILGLSLGGAFLIAGGVAGIASLVKTSDVEKHCDGGSCDASQADAISSANTLANVANVCVPIGALGIAYGLYELLTLPPASESRASVEVQFTGAGAVVRGSL